MCKCFSSITRCSFGNADIWKKTKKIKGHTKMLKLWHFWQHVYLLSLKQYFDITKTLQQHSRHWKVTGPTRSLYKLLFLNNRQIFNSDDTNRIRKLVRTYTVRTYQQTLPNMMLRVSSTSLTSDTFVSHLSFVNVLENTERF